MTAHEDSNVRKTFCVLESAKTDNEKFAALLLFAKTTNAKDLSIEDRRKAIDALGITFFNRLLKSKNVPEDCSATVYKSLALKILSGLCGDSQLVIDFEVYKILRSINDTITDETSETEMVDDCYDLLTALTQTEEGAIKLVEFGTITALSEVITKQLYSYEKAQSMLQSLLHFCGEYAWKKDAPSMHLILEHFCKQLDTFQDERKFELCVVVAGIISCMTKEIGKNSLQRPWFSCLNHAMNDIFTSKLGQPQRDPALRMASCVLDKLGVDCILPPHRDNCKLLLVIIHLSCIEIRITLENLTPEQINANADILVSCYNLLELIICYMTSAPSLKLDEHQVLQLHSAMEGAFNSVIFYLREQSEQGDQVDNPSQIVLASVRVLGSWVAEETSALKVKVQEILPFIVKLCKCQMESLHNSIKSTTKKKTVKFESASNMDSQEEKCLSMLETCDIGLKTESKEEKKVPSFQDIGSDTTDSGCDSCSHSMTAVDHTCTDYSCETGNVPESELITSDSLQDESTVCSKKSHCAESIPETDSGISEQSPETGVNSVSMETRDITINNVDLIGFLLPGFCHMTADDSSRKVLLDNNLQSSLSDYFSSCVESLTANEIEEDSLKSLETLCGVFLNLVVLEPQLIGESEDLHKVTKNIFYCATVLRRNESSLTLWANIVTLGVFFLRHQNHIKYDKDQLTNFFSTVVTFMKAPYTSSVVNNTEVLMVTEAYLPVWDSIYQLWYLCIQATTACLPLYPSLVYAMMSTGFLPHIIRLLNKVQGRNVDEDTLLCLIGVITSLVTTEPKAKDVLRSCGGLEFSKMYNCSELEKLIT